MGEERLRALLTKLGLRPRDVIRMKEPGAWELPLDDDEAVLARPPEKVLEILD